MSVIALNLVTVTWSVEDVAEAGTAGSVTFRLSNVVTDPATGDVISPDPPRKYQFTGVPGSSDPLVANDNTLEPSGSYYVVTVAGSTSSYQFNVAVNYANGATQRLGDLIANQIVPPPAMAAYLPLPAGTPEPGDVPTVVAGTQTTWAPSGTGGSGYPAAPVVSGTPAAGQVLTATSATAATWETPSGGGGAVSSVFGRTGAVVAESGDYTAAQVGADPAGSADTAQSNAESYAAAQASAAQSAAEAASLPLPSGTASAGYVPVATGSGSATQWGPSSGSGFPASPAVSGTPAAGQVLTATSATAATWETPASGAWQGGVPAGYYAPAVVSVTDASTIAVNAIAGNYFRVSLTAAVGATRAVGVPASPADGQEITFEFIQPASGGPCTVTWAAGTGGYTFGAAGAPPLSAAASASDLVSFRYSGAKQMWECITAPAVAIDTAASDFMAPGRIPAAGATGKAADAGHVHPASIGWFNVVTGYGADKTGTADATTAIQNAINAANTAGGGVVYFPAGTYKFSSPLTLYTGITLQGDSMSNTKLQMAVTNTSGIIGNNVSFVTINDMSIEGPYTGTSGTGISLTWTTQDNTYGVNMNRTIVWGWAGTGIAVQNCIVSTFTQVISENNATGFYFYGVDGGAAGTSVTMNSCYANGNAGDGYHFRKMTYCVLNGCAADSNGQGYLIEGCEGITLNSCGAEGTLVQNGYNGYSFAVQKSSAGDISKGIVLNGCYSYLNPAVALYIGANCYNIGVICFEENTPAAGAANSVAIAAGARADIHSLDVTTATSFAGSVNYTDDGGGDMQAYGGLFVSGKSYLSGVVHAYAGTDTSAAAPAASVPAFTSGTAQQLSTASDVILYIAVKTSANITVAIGPTASVPTTLVPGITPAVGLMTVRVPMSWYVKITTTATISDFGFTQVPC